MEDVSWNLERINTSVTKSFRGMAENKTSLVIISLFLTGVTYILFSPLHRTSLVKGNGLSVGMYLFICFMSYYFFPYKLIALYCLLLVPIHLWTFPLEELSQVLTEMSKVIHLAAKIRKQLPNIVRYTWDLLPFMPQMLEKMDVVLANIEVMGEAMPVMMQEKKYILPVMPQIIEKLDIIAPTVPSILPIIHKVAPKIHLLLPKIELVAPYIDDLVPLWDQLDPHMETLLLEMDNLAPLLPKMAKDMDRMVPVLNLMPLVHEIGALNVELVKKNLPWMTKLLPTSQHVVARSMLSKASLTLEKFANRGKELLENRKKNVNEKDLPVVILD